MKFAVVETGQRFNFKGEHYVKSSPLVANHVKTGQQKLFKRADNVEVLFDVAANNDHPESVDGNTLDVEKVMQSFEQFYSRCINALDDNLSIDLADEKNALFTAMEQAKHEFVNNCKKV